MYYLLHDNQKEVSRKYKKGMQYENDSLINHAARFGSINCFRFLFLLDSNIDEKTLQNAYLGGNQEIIQICENKLNTYNPESNALYPDSDCVEKLIQTHQNDILINIIEEKSLSNGELRKRIKYSWAACHIYFNIDFFIYMYNNFGPFHIDKSNNTIFYCTTFITLLELEDELCNNDIYDNLNQATPAIIWASRHNSLSLLTKLFESNKCSLSNRAYGCSALSYTAGRNSFECAKYLISISKGDGVKILDAYNRTDLYYAAKNDSYEVAELFIKEGMDIHHLDNHGRTALFECAEWNTVNVAKLLIASGVKINHQNNFGETALSICSWRDSYDVAKLLIDNNADKDIVSNEGNSPLMWCCEKNAVNVAKLLIVSGCNIWIKNNENEAAETISAVKSPEIYSYLMDHIRKMQK